MTKKTKIISYAVVLLCLAFFGWRLVLLVTTGQWKGRFSGWRTCETFWCYSTGILFLMTTLALSLFALYLLHYHEKYVQTVFRRYRKIKEESKELRRQRRRS